MKYLAVVLSSVMLVACGGGGSDATTTVKPSGTGIGFQAGDSLTYSNTATPTSTTTGSPAAFLQTRTVSKVNSDSSYTRLLTYSDGTTFIAQDFSASNQETAYQFGGTSCTNLPTTTAPSAPYSVGQTWDYSWTRTCITTNTSTVTTNTSKGSVTGTETITTQAGTFNTYKLVYTDEVNSSTGKTTYAYTCWRDKDLDRTVLCNYTSSFLPTNQTTPTSTYAYVQQLIGVSVSAFSGSRPIVERFAGKWSFINWTAAGSCGNLTISVTGLISGTCMSATGGVPMTYPFSGAVDANGVMQATLTTGTFSGTFNSPLRASGSASFPGIVAAWTLGHL